MDFVTTGVLSLQKTKSPSRVSVLSGSAIHSALGASFFADTGLVLDSRNQINEQWDMGRIKISTKIEDNFRKPMVLHLGSDDPLNQTRMMENFSPRKMKSIDTHHTWILENKKNLENLRDEVDVIFLNQEEARLMTGEKDPMKAAKTIADGCSAVIKLGPKGVIVADSDIIHLPAFPTKVVDDSYAGDAFAGAFMGYLSKRPSLVKAGLYANVVASFAIEGWGPNRLMEISRKDVNKRYKKYLKMF